MPERIRTEIQGLLERDAILRQALRHLPARTAPAGFTSRLRQVAAQHLADQAAHDRAVRGRSWRKSLALPWEPVRSLQGRLQLTYTNFMRPLAVPALAGTFSAFMLFHLFVASAYPWKVVRGSDIPTQLATEARVKGSLFSNSSPGNLTMGVVVDEQGQTADYEIVPDDVKPNDGKLDDEKPDARTVRSIEDRLMRRETFEPATSFGKPMGGTILVQFSHILVKG